MTRLNPYIHFKNNTQEAMEFYKTVFNAKLKMTTYKEGKMSQDPSEKNKIMHAILEANNGITLMATDSPNRVKHQPETNISISLSGKNEQELRDYWNKLSSNATITMPLEKAPWGDTFGMLTDKFGIDWMVNITS